VCVCVLPVDRYWFYATSIGISRASRPRSLARKMTKIGYTLFTDKTTFMPVIDEEEQKRGCL
jgi:hypothetical protein